MQQKKRDENRGKFEYVKEWEKEFTIAHTDFVGIFFKEKCQNLNITETLTKKNYLSNNFNPLELTTSRLAIFNSENNTYLLKRQLDFLFIRTGVVVWARATHHT